MRRHGYPRLIDDLGKQIPLKRVDFTDESIKESWLQKVLHQSPEILPIDELDSSFAPVLSIGREILGIDNLFISPYGRITLVETKLWRNPEAMRQVVAQILDYAKRLSALNYNDLENMFRNATNVKHSKSPLYEHVRSAFPEDVHNERDFCDAVQTCLKNARFMLLIVGDGIRENVENMVELFQRHPQMLFTFGLVELQVFESPLFPGKLLIPHVIARTTEIVRAVVRVEGSAKTTVLVDLEDEKTGGSPKHTLSEQEFLDQVKNTKDRAVYQKLLAYASEIGAYPEWASNTVSIRLPDPQGSSGHIRLLRLKKDGTIKAIGHFGGYKELGFDDQIAWQWLESIASLFDNINVLKEEHKLSRVLTAKEIEEQYDEFIEILKSTVEKIRMCTS